MKSFRLESHPVLFPEENQCRRRSPEAKHVDDASQKVDVVRRNKSETEPRGIECEKKERKGCRASKSEA